MRGKVGHVSARSEMAFVSSPLAVSVSELKMHLRIEHDSDDTYLSNLILTAQQYVSNNIASPLINATCKSYYNFENTYSEMAWWQGVKHGSMNQFYTEKLNLDYPRVLSVTSVKSYNVSSAETVVDPAFYRLDKSSLKPSIVKTPNASWGNDFRSDTSMIVEYVSGFGTTANDVPYVIKHAMMVLCAHWYENRQYYNVGMPFSGQIATVNQSVAHSVTSMLQQYRVMAL